MALNIPMPESPGDSLIKGLNAGGDLIHKMMLNKYYGTLHPSGDVANAMYVEQLRQQYGEDDPRYIQAKTAHELALNAKNSLIDYRGGLTDTLGIRYTSPMGKEIKEGEGQGATDIMNNRNKRTGTSSGYSYNADGSNTVATPNEVGYVAQNGNDADAGGDGDTIGADTNPRTSQERDAYERKIAKDTGDADARKRMRFAENVDITRNSINKDDLTRYSGPQGVLQHIGDWLGSLNGKPAERFIAHSKAAKAADLLAKQMRQFYGDSIQKPAMEKIEAMTNPSAWYKPSKVAQAEWDQLNTILDAETGTYKKYGTSPIKLNGLGYKDGKFFVAGSKKPGQDAEENTGNEGGSINLKAVLPRLLKINPNYTEANIRSTAKQRKTTIDDVVSQLMQRAAKGGQ